MERRYHLWLKLSRNASERFADVIQQLALELNTPTFEPHITLLGNVKGSEPELLARAKELAGRVPSIPISVREAAFDDDYFRCAFMVVDITRPLRYAHTLAREIFREEGGGEYLPHVSLVYGRYPDNRKKDLIAKLPASLLLPFEASRLSLIHAGSDDPKDWQEVWGCSMGDALWTGVD